MAITSFHHKCNIISRLLSDKFLFWMESSALSADSKQRESRLHVEKTQWVLPLAFLFKRLGVISMKLPFCGFCCKYCVSISYRFLLLLLISNTQSNYRFSHVGRTQHVNKSLSTGGESLDIETRRLLVITSGGVGCVNKVQLFLSHSSTCCSTSSRSISNSQMVRVNKHFIFFQR